MGGQDPAMHRRRLRIALRQLRASAKLTQVQAAETLGWHSSKLLRIENGKSGVTRTDLKALLNLYGVTDSAQADELIEVARHARGQSWAKYKDEITPEYRTLLGYLGSALLMRQFEPILLPGMLQTREYAEAAISALSAEGESEDVIARRVQARLESQDLLTAADAPNMHFLIDEAAFRRHVGGRAVMLDQLEHLKEVNRRQANVTIQVIPFTVGEHVGMRGPFIVLEFAEGDDPLLYLEHPRSDALSRDDQDETTIYQERFLALATLATPAARFDRIVDEVIASMDVPHAATIDSTEPADGVGSNV